MATTRGTLTAINFRVQRKASAFMILIIIYKIVIVSGDAVHLTMVTTTPYRAVNSEVHFICLRSSPDTDLTFGRPFQIGIPGSSIQSATTLPPDSFIWTYTTPSAVRQYLPQNSLDSTGLFYCEGSNSGMTSRVYSIIHAIRKRFEPVDGLVTKTVNRGENVTLSITSLAPWDAPLWRRIRNGTVDDLNSTSGQGTLEITALSSDVMDGDLYAVIASGLPTSDNHFGMIRLIVRGCSAGQWGPPACTGICDYCFNGGVCDDETGQCICAPGFKGPNCLTACGMHRFGWDCEFQCGYIQIISCELPFGLPDPYGSSCISGYSGRNCDTVCSRGPFGGSFGAGCTQTCHCQNGTYCDIFTGVCSSGCAAGWSGVNCQEPCDIGQCQNGGTCLPQGTSFRCSCRNGFSGMYCQTDEQAPLVSGCPDPINLNLPQGSSEVVATWTEPSTSETVGVSQNKTHEPGSRFRTGETTVTYTFTDQAGNSAICTFNVTVSALPMLSHPSMVNVEPTSATVTWQAWNNAMDTGDGPIIAYVVYFTSMGDSNWVSAGNITNTTQATYSFLVTNLEPATEYSFSVASVRDGEGGEGPRGPSTRIQTLPLLAKNEAPSAGSSTTIAIICVTVVVSRFL